MKARYVVLLMIGSVIVTGSAIAFGYYLSQEDVVDDNVATQTQSQTSGNAGSGGLQVTSSGTQGLQGAGLGGDVAGQSTNSDGQLPTPDQFDVYDEYSEETSTLYQTISEGSGREVAQGDYVQVLYRGWLTDGTLFDQSFDSDGNPSAFEFQIGTGQVIPGWDQGIIGMQEGEVRRLIVPPSVGYGEAGQGPIPPSALLVFDVELLGADSQSAVESGL